MTYLDGKYTLLAGFELYRVQ